MEQGIFYVPAIMRSVYSVFSEVSFSACNNLSDFFLFYFCNQPSSRKEKDGESAVFSFFYLEIFGFFLSKRLLLFYFATFWSQKLDESRKNVYTLVCNYFVTIVLTCHDLHDYRYSSQIIK